jgi:hypothetical protein
MSESKPIEIDISSSDEISNEPIVKPINSANNRGKKRNHSTAVLPKNELKSIQTDLTGKL